jgi:RNA polymerase sigma-70 factor, ECF subfamily
MPIGIPADVHPDSPTLPWRLDTGLGLAMDWLELLYDSYHRQALGVALGVLGNRGDAEDVVQEALLVAWRAREQFDPAKGSARAWFLTLVRHRAIDALRARQVRRTDTIDEQPQLADDTDVLGTTLASLDGEWVREALDYLPAEQRQAIELAYFAGLTHNQIAARLELPLGTVKGRVRLALDRLRIVLNAEPDAVVTTLATRPDPRPAFHPQARLAASTC